MKTYDRKPVVAAVLSLLAPGLGQLYCGSVRRFAVFLIINSVLLMSVSFIWGSSLEGVSLIKLFMLAVFVSVLVGFFVVWDAFLYARRLPASTVLRPFQRWWVYGAVIAIWFAIPSEFILPIQSYNIPSSSMAPTLLVGDYLLVDKRANCLNCRHPLNRGDVVVFYRYDPAKDDTAFIKRIVGLPGDKISVQDKKYFINGQPLTYEAGPKKIDIPGLIKGTLSNPKLMWEIIGDKRHLIIWDRVIMAQDLADEFEVPADHVYVIGDNRQHSKDSRMIGPIPIDRVVGRARVVYFHRDQISQKPNLFYRIGEPL